MSDESSDLDEGTSAVTDEINIIWDVPKDDGGYPITGLLLQSLIQSLLMYIPK